MACRPSGERPSCFARKQSYSLADIAAVTGANEETVKSRLRYAVKKLRIALGTHNGNQEQP